ncbi:DNA polymerase III subunit psi [Shewanella sp. Isolate11]|uniref:DNA polymerase III subunit psi n=1 Tax=Shewanella sp. Isolate11 TaxID=2908530 RepID=UPI001EFD8D06|nr:DNA polymerase III subunit psi [Shewanella sp. Isolate11]MCG9697429.1 DNA polymerase III subunit psi [Shewanella sp. Isolate11]
MDKTAYLDAMGISRWVQQSELPDTCIILVDKQAVQDAEHPIIKAVLGLFNLDSKQVVFSVSVAKSQTIFWDMRSAKLPKITCAISSASIVQLEQQAQAKQALWQSICGSERYGKAYEAAN